MIGATATKYIYRDLKTGRLIHQRQAEALPGDRWTKEVFVPELGIEASLTSVGSALQPVMDVDEEQEAPASTGTQAG